MPGHEELYSNPAQTIGGALDQEQERLRIAASDRAPIDAQRAGRVLRVGGLTGLPRELVDSDLDNLEGQLERREFHYVDYVDTPTFRQFATDNPYNLSVVREDLRGLPWYERGARRLSMSYTSGQAEVELASIYTRRMHGDEREDDEARIAELEKYQVDHEFGAGLALGRMFVSHAHQSAIMVRLGVEGLKYGALGAPMGAAVGVGLGGVGALPGAAVGFSTGFSVGSAGAAYDLEAGLAYKEYIEAGFEEETAATAAKTVGVVNAGLEAVGFNVVARYLPGFRAIKGSVARQLVSSVWQKPTMRGAYAQFAREYGTALASELVTEVLQETVTAMGQEHLKREARAAGDDRPELAAMTWDEWTDLAGEIVVETLKGSAFFAGAGPAAGILSESGRARRAREAELPWRLMGEAAENSTVREQHPEVWREYLQKIDEDGPVNEVLIDRARFEEYWESKGVSPITAANELGVDLESLAEQESDIRVPLATFTEKIAGTPHYNELVKDVRIREDDMTIREAEAWESKRDEQIAEVESALQETHNQTTNEEVYESLLQKMLATGAYERSAAEKMARLNAAIFTNKAAELGVDPVELWDSRFRGLEVEGDVALQRKDVDIVLDPLIEQLRSGTAPKQREIFGPSLVEEAVARGGLIDEGGELSAQDAGKAVRGLIRETGQSLDGAAEWAFENGYIAAYDENLFIDAVHREINGDPVHAPGKLDEGLLQQSRILETLYDYIQAEGLDLSTMSNAEIRAKLTEGREFEQGFDKEGLESLTQLVLESAEWDSNSLERAKEILDTIADEQNLGDIAVEEQVKLAETGDVKTISRKLQVDWDRQVKRRNILNKLKECLG